MSYEIRNNSFRSHLTGREYKFSNREERYQAMGLMLQQDAEVRDAAQQRAKDAGVTRPLSDREIAQGNFMPDRRTTVERIADEALKNGAKHDPFVVAIDMVRASMRSNDSTDKRAADEATIARLEEKSARLAQDRAVNPVVELDPSKPEVNAAALRNAAKQVADGFAPLSEDRARNQRMAESLLREAEREDARAAEEQAHAAKLKDLEPWVADSGASLYLLAKDPRERQENVNAVRDIHQRLKTGNATKDEWFGLVKQIDEERAARKQALLDANATERQRLDLERTAIREDKPVDPPAPEASHA
jgi:hypothetical protein